MKLIYFALLALSLPFSSVQAYDGLWRLAGGQGDCTLQLSIGKDVNGDYSIRGGNSPLSPILWSFEKIDQGKYVICPGYEDCESQSTFNKYQITREARESENKIEERYLEKWTMGPNKGKVKATITLRRAPFGISFEGKGKGYHMNGRKFKSFDCQYH